MRRVAPLLVSLILGCDPVAQAPAKGEAPSKGEPAKSEPAVPAPASDLASCLDECGAKGDISEDDMATCRVQCQAAHGGAKDAEHPQIGSYMACHDECASKSADDAPTCRLNCAATVAGDEGELADSRCPRTCLEGLGTCLASCDGTGKTDDSATCRVTCKQSTGKCLDACKPK